MLSTSVYFLKSSIIKHLKTTTKKCFISHGEENIHRFLFRRVLINLGVGWNVHPFSSDVPCKTLGRGDFKLKRPVHQKF